MNKIISAVFGIIILSAACKKEDDPSPPQSQDPFRTGSITVQLVTNLTENGDTINSFEVTWVTEEQTIGGSKWFVAKDEASGGTVLSIQKRSDGWWWIPYPNPNPSLFLKVPAAVSEQYLVNTFDGSVDTAKIRAVGVTVNAIGINYAGCNYMQLFNNNGLRNEFYYRDDGAVIKENVYQRNTVTGNDFVAQTWEFKSFTY